MPHKYSGKLIVFEGGEGSGKSTLIKALSVYLRSVGYDVIATKEPYGEYRKRLLDAGSEIELTPEQELDLFIENRAEHFNKLIIPCLREGRVILCDRSSPSTVAYQHYGRGLDLTGILVEDALARQNAGFDMVILLDIDPEIGLKRKNPETRFELEDIDFHHRVRHGYLEQAKNDPDKKWIVIDASKPAETVFDEVCEAISKFLRERSRW